MSEVKKEKKTKKTVAKKATVSEKIKKEEIKKEPKAAVKKATVSEKVKKEEIKTEPQKEVKVERKEKGLLKKKDQKNYSVLSKLIMILSRIGRILLMICIPFIILAMVIIPIVFGKCEISANVIKCDNVYVVIREDSVNFKIGDSVHTVYCNSDELNHLTDLLSNNSKGTILFFLEASLLLLAGLVILNIYILTYLEKIFTNFVHGKTPFTAENTNYILKIAKLLIAVEVVGLLMSMIGIFSVGEGVVGIVGILIIFVIYYVFKYATLMQKATETQIVD